MPERGEAAVGRARGLIGTRFRAQGRDPALGLDCVGLVLAVHRIDPRLVRGDYALGGAIDVGELDETLARWFRRIGRRQLRAGDLILAATGKRRCHLAIHTEDGVIHADAGLRKVVELLGPPPWPILGYYRRRSRARRTRKG